MSRSAASTASVASVASVASTAALTAAASDIRPPPELAAVLFKRTLLATAAVALIAALGLGALTIVNVKQEVRAARELVELAVHASRLTAAEPGTALLEPDHSMLRGLRLELVDGRSGTALPHGPGSDWADAGQAPRHLLEGLAGRWFGVSDRFTIPLTQDADGPALLVRGHAVGELQEQLFDMFIVLAALALAVAALGFAHGWVVRGVRNPLADMTRAAVSMAEGELSRRIAEPRVAEFAALARALNHLAGSLQQTRTMQTALTAELLSLRENERKSLARELHDDLGQRLAVIAAETHLLRTQLGSEGVAVRSIAAGIQALQHSVRSMLERLREGQPMLLPDPDAAAILEDWRRREPGIDWQVDPLDGDTLAGFDDLARETLARVVQEALANAFRHARPTQMSVRFVQDAQTGQLTVRNDGVPMVSDAPEEPADPRTRPGRSSGDGHGILGMSERAQGAGGRLNAGAGAEAGTWVVVLAVPKSRARQQVLPPKRLPAVQEP